MVVQNLPKGPLHIFRHYATYRRPKKYLKTSKKIRIFFQFFSHVGTVEENTWHFEVLLLFLSLRYGADLGRSRLVLVCFATLRIFFENYSIHEAILLFISKKRFASSKVFRLGILALDISATFLIACLFFEVDYYAMRT